MIERLELERQTYRRVGYTLLGGLLLSIAVMIVGIIVTLAEGKNVTTVLRLDQEFSHLSRLEPSSILDLGILVLFATPFAGLLIALVQFARERDTTFILITSLLLLIVMAGFVLALVGSG